MMALLSFIITISLLVIIHEFGHYLAARLFKVKVISFSVGFGPKLLKFNTKHNEWLISAIPFGGYVKMLDEREQSVPQDQQQFAYNNKHPFQKIIIAFTGPFFNIIFAYLALCLIAHNGITELKPKISSLNLSPLIINASKTPILPDSQIISLNNKAVATWQEANDLFKHELNKNSTITFNLKTESSNYFVNLNFSKYLDNGNELSLTDAGLYPFIYLNRISYVSPNSAANAIGLQINDQITMLDNQKILDWFQLMQIIHDNPARKLAIEYQHNESTINTFITPTTVTNENGQIFGKLGIMPSLDESNLTQNSFIHKYDTINSLKFGFTSSYAIIFSNLQIIGSMFSGKTSLDNLGGPISIAKASNEALHEGFNSFLQLLALISLSIAVMNLLPIPVLDGGHILIYSIEWLIGKQINKETQQIIFTIGLIFVLSIMSIAFFNDFSKLFNW